MLQPADAGPGSWTDSSTSGDWKLEFILSLCDNRSRDTIVSTLDEKDIRLERAADGTATSGISLPAVLWRGNLLSEIELDPGEQVDLAPLIDKALARICLATASC